MFGKMAPAAVVAFGMIFSNQAVAAHYGSEEHAATYRACKKNPHSKQCRAARKAHHGAHWGKHERRGIHLETGASDRH